MSELLTVTREISAEPEVLFDAWTDPQKLTQWWGPAGVTCPAASVDLCVGGAYSITNRLPDGRQIIISGEYLAVERSRLLAFTWRLDSDHDDDGTQTVNVRFVPIEQGTRVVVVHHRIPNEVVRQDHDAGWQGTLDGLREFVARRR